jgi:hypothetical protein
MNTNIISGLMNCLTAISSLLFVDIRVHSWLKFFPGSDNGHIPQNPLVPVIVKWIGQLAEKRCQKLQAHSGCATTVGLIRGIVKSLMGKWRSHDDTLNHWLTALSVPRCEIPIYIQSIAGFVKSL